jgi:glycosyltransferase involved in cell wall biosynthesis
MASTGSISSVTAEPHTRDYVVAMLAFNQARTIQAAISAARAVLDSGVLGLRGGLVVADGGSTDDTSTVARSSAGATGDVQVLSLPGQASEVISLPYHGMPGRARALRLALGAARDADAGVVAVVDATAPDTAERITRLLRPVLAGPHDLAAPVYTGRPFDGMLVKSIIRPLFQTCFGLRLRHPTGPEFACSRRLINHLLQPRVWPADAGDAGIDLWLSTTAAVESFAMCEVVIGPRATGRDDAPDLSDALAQVVGALFREMDRRAAVWQRVRASKAVDTVDGLAAATSESPSIDVRRPLEAFRLGCRELSEVWADVLPPATVLELRRLAAVSDASFRLPDRTWARIVIDFAVGYRHRVIARDHLLRALAPLYLAWIASLMIECEAASAAAVEARIERLCETFETEKAYLISRWRWPERFRPR